MNDFISFSNDEILIYNIINSKIYKYFLKYHKNIGCKFYNDINDLSPLNQYKISKEYCKTFKYNYCLCYRQSLKLIINNIDDFDNDLFICSNNFNFINRIFINKKNKIYPINIFTFYRQEYIPFIIKEEFIKIKNKYNNIIVKQLKKYFNNFKNSYYNDLKNIFDKSIPSNANNYSLILSII